MTTLAADSVRKYVPVGTDVNHMPVIAADIIYEGAAVGDNASGYARPLVAGDPFRGFAMLKADNAAGAAGAKNVEVRRFGVVELSITSLAITDVGKDVYASDDNAFTLTQGANTRIGHVVKWIATGKGLVAFEAQRSDIAELTDSTTGTPDGIVADVSTVVTGVDGTGSNAASKADVDTRLDAINENFSDLADKVNELTRRLGA